MSDTNNHRCWKIGTNKYDYFDQKRGHQYKSGPEHNFFGTQEQFDKHFKTYKDEKGFKASVAWDECSDCNDHIDDTCKSTPLYACRSHCVLF